jgi:predicted GNAT superfamily acetyltransferase
VVFLPLLVIYEESRPHAANRDGVPGEWLYGFSESGYMDSDLFFKWFRDTFIMFDGEQNMLIDAERTAGNVALLRIWCLLTKP